jgi:hypothetical protein
MNRQIVHSRQCAVSLRNDSHNTNAKFDTVNLMRSKGVQSSDAPVLIDEALTVPVTKVPSSCTLVARVSFQGWLHTRIVNRVGRLRRAMQYSEI